MAARQPPTPRAGRHAAAAGGRTRGALAVTAAAFGVGLAAPGSAAAHTFPAGDVLPVQDVFFPQAPPTSQGVARAVVMMTRRARAAGWPVKIAIIGGARDLGPDRSFFGRPQAYADFLGSEFGAPRLLVVMPQGIGGQRLGSLHLARAGLRTGAGDDRGDALALLAMTVVARLASDNGIRWRSRRSTAVPPDAGRTSWPWPPALALLRRGDVREATAAERPATRVPRCLSSRLSGSC